MKTALVKYSMVLILSLILPMTAAAEFYRYVDPHGNVIYTDDISKVPVDKRPQAKMYDESRSETPVVPEKTQTTKSAVPLPEKERQAINQEGQRLQEVQEKLNREYDVLVKENAALKSEQKEAVTPEEIKSVNKKVVSFNARFNAYKEKEAAYTTELNTHKQRIKDAEKNQAEK